MIKINLLPYREILKKESIITHAVIAGASLFLIILLIVLVDSVMRSKVNKVEQNIVKIERKLAQGKVQVAEIKKLKQEKETYRKQFQVIESLKKGKEGPVRILDELATTIPERIWLQTLKQSGNSIELVGIAVDNKLISKFMSNLQKSPYFKKIDLIATEMKLQSAGKIKEKLNKFTLTCTFTSPSER
jgi:type IV pilus assembly protein PilN